MSFLRKQESRFIFAQPEPRKHGLLRPSFWIPTFVGMTRWVSLAEERRFAHSAKILLFRRGASRWQGELPKPTVASEVNGPVCQGRGSQDAFVQLAGVEHAAGLLR